MPPRRRNGYAAQYDLKTRAPVVIPKQPPLNTEYVSKDARPALSGRYIRDPKYSESDEDLDYKGYDPDAPKKKKRYVYVNDLDEYQQLCQPDHDQPGPSTHNELAKSPQPAESAYPDPTTGYDPDNQTNFFFGSSTEGSNASVTSGSQTSATSERSFSSSGSRHRTRSISSMSTLTNISKLSSSYQASMASEVTPEGPSNTFPDVPAAPEDNSHTAGSSSNGRNLNSYDAGSARIPAWAKGKWVAGADKPSGGIRKTVSGAGVKSRASKEEKDLAKGLFLAKALAAFDRGDGDLLLDGYEKRVVGRQKMSPTSFKRGLARLSSNNGRSDTSVDYGRLAIERHMPNEFHGPFSSVSGNDQGDTESLYLGSSAANIFNQYHSQELQSGSAVGENGSRYRERSRSPGVDSNATLRQDSSTLRRSASPLAMDFPSYRSRSRRVSSNIHRSVSPPAMDLLSYGTRPRRSIKALYIPTGPPVPFEDFTHRRIATPSTALALWDTDGDEDALDAAYATPPPPEKAPAGSGTHKLGNDHDEQVHRSVFDDDASDNDYDDAYTIDEDFHGNRNSAAGAHRSKLAPKFAIRRSQSEGTSLFAATRSRRAS